MADFACDFCGKVDECKYAFNESYCLVDDIKLARQIVAYPSFGDFYKFISELAEETGEDRAIILEDRLRDCISTAEFEL